MIQRHPFPIYHGRLMGYTLWYTQHKHETNIGKPYDTNRTRHTLNGCDSNDLAWCVSIVLEDISRDFQTQLYRGGRESTVQPMNTLAWGTDKYFKFVSYEFSGDVNVMRNIMTMLRFVDKHGIVNTYTDPET